jgi:two-component system, cell cycle sensor histidine kinase and response regulator CckA
MIVPDPNRAMSAVDESHVLVVDDDTAICDAYAEILSARGFSVSTAGSRVDALAEIDRLNGQIDVLILDISLPDVDGPDLAREIVECIGHRPTLYVSGWTEEFWNLSHAPGKWRVMRKPIPIPELLQTVAWLARPETRH